MASKIDHNRFQIKDFITITLSGLAFLVAAISAYFTVIRQTDKLSVVVMDYPHAGRVSATRLGFSSQSLNLAFINSGTRPAVILEVRLLIYQRRTQTEQACESTGSSQIDLVFTRFEPTVVKPNDVATKEFTITTRNSFGMDPDVAKMERAPIEICYSIAIATPDKAFHRSSVSAVKYTVPQQQDFPFDQFLDHTTLFEDLKRERDLRPKMLIDETRVFGFPI